MPKSNRATNDARALAKKLKDCDELLKKGKALMKQIDKLTAHLNGRGYWDLIGALGAMRASIRKLSR